MELLVPVFVKPDRSTPAASNQRSELPLSNCTYTFFSFLDLELQTKAYDKLLSSDGQVDRVYGGGTRDIVDILKVEGIIRYLILARSGE